MRPLASIPLMLLGVAGCLEPNPEHDGLVSDQLETSSASSDSDLTLSESGMDEGDDASQTGGGDGDGDGEASTGDGDAGTTGDGDGDLSCAVSSASLVMCHDFENLTQNVFADLSGQGNDIMATAPVVEVGPWSGMIIGGAGTAYEIDDSSSLDLTDAFTFEFQVRPDSLPNNGRRGILDKDGQYSVFQYPDRIECGSGSIGHASAQVNAGEWTYVACTWDGQEIVLYLDGVEVATVSATGTLPTDNTEPMALLDSSPDFTEPFDGAMDGLRVWNTARSPEEVCATWGGGGC